MLLSHYHRTRLLLLAGWIASAILFLFASHTFRVPTDPHHGGSLLASGSPWQNLLIVGITLLVAVMLSTLIAGTVRFDAGLFCAALGMAALSARSGKLGDVLRESAGTSTASTAIFIHFALELLLLYALLALAWCTLWILHARGFLKADEFRDGVEDTDEPLIFKVSAAGMQIGVMLLVMMLLAQSDAKAQVLAAVGISSFLGALAAYNMYPISPSPWLWSGPLLVGVAGYALAWFNLNSPDALWPSGELARQGPNGIVHSLALAPLARPLPLDYATAGPAGAILGYWFARRWHRQRLAEATPESAT